MNNIYAGGCRCGQVRYSISAEPVTQMICHCNGCLKRSGPYMGGMFVPTDHIEILGDYSRSMDVGGTGKPLECYSCRDCGSIFALYVHAVPLMTVIIASSLDDQSTFAPVFHNWVSEKPHWVTIADELPKFERSVEWEKLGGRPNLGTPVSSSELGPETPR